MASFVSWFYEDFGWMTIVVSSLGESIDAG